MRVMVAATGAALKAVEKRMRSFCRASSVFFSSVRSRTKLSRYSRPARGMMRDVMLTKWGSPGGRGSPS